MPIPAAVARLNKVVTNRVTRHLVGHGDFAELEHVGMARMPAPARFLLPRIGVDEFVELPVLQAVSVRAGAPRTGS